MAELRLPALQSGVPIVGKDGGPTPQFQRLWQSLTEQLQVQEARQDAVIEQLAIAQAQLAAAEAQLEAAIGYLLILAGYNLQVQTYQSLVNGYIGWIIEEAELDQSHAPYTLPPAPTAPGAPS